MIFKNKKQLSASYIHDELLFGVSVALAIDQLAKHENDLKAIQAAITHLLIALGFEEEDSFSASATMGLTGTLTDFANKDEIYNTLPAMVCVAGKLIINHEIPAHIRETVRESLAEAN